MDSRYSDASKSIALIRRWVERYRAAYGITPRPGLKPEPSCEAFGEGHNLLYCQLATTPFPHDGWQEVTCGASDPIRNMIADTILRDSHETLKRICGDGPRRKRLLRKWEKGLRGDTESGEARWQLLELLVAHLS